MSENCVRLLFDNYIETSILANYDVSSEQTAFPVENAFNKSRRSKVWRSNGYFKIDSTNNQIVFRETNLGSNLVASIAVGEYTSLTTFCAAIKTALEAVGDSTYTVTNTVSTGWKFQIVSNGAGGGGVFQLFGTNASFTAVDIIGFSDSMDRDEAGLTKLADFLRINSEEWIEYDMGLETNPKVFALIGPRNTPIKLAPSGVFKLQANETGNWDDPSFEVTLEYDDRCLFYENELGIADVPYRFWRVLFEDQNANGFIEVGAFFLGNYWEPTGKPQFPVDIQEVDRTTNSFSEGGQSFSDIRQPTSIYSLTYANLKKEDVEILQDYFVEYGTGKPFFASLDTDEFWSSTAQRRLILCKFQSEPKITLSSANFFEADIQLREEL